MRRTAGGTPTLDEILARAVEQGTVGQITDSHVQRILLSGEVHPHRIQQWLHSTDPAFREKVNRSAACIAGRRRMWSR